jgi:hypothetical protein
MDKEHWGWGRGAEELGTRNEQGSKIKVDKRVEEGWTVMGRGVGSGGYGYLRSL